MLNYIRAEAYKLLCRPYTYITLAVMLALEGIFAEGFAFHNSHSSATPFGGAIVNIVGMGVIGFCMCMLTGDIVFAGQYKNSTLKNEVSFGLSRTRIYLGKLIAQTLLSLVYLVVMMAFFIGLCAICLPMEGPAGFYSSGDALFIVGYFLAAALPLWLGAQAAMCMCLFLTSGEMTSYFLYVGLVFVLETVVDVVGLLVGGGFGELLLNIRRHFPGFLMDATKSLVGDWGHMGKVWLVGAFWVAACTAIGLYGFHKKEIK
ncbi:MAG: ABC transporter permease subunit [Oscillospiraceae bacterium]|nr:ABC transporter permease subunit [Oscillospiraceae bacterium]MDE6841825.1 ABC transporter permease [Oscillospiraceae bacterium]